MSVKRTTSKIYSRSRRVAVNVALKGIDGNNMEVVSVRPCIGSFEFDGVRFKGRRFNRDVCTEIKNIIDGFDPGPLIPDRRVEKFFVILPPGKGEEIRSWLLKQGCHILKEEK